MNYRRVIATALLALSIATAGCQRSDWSDPQPAQMGDGYTITQRPQMGNGYTLNNYVSECPTPTEDSKVECNLDPTARYDYDRGAWRQVDDSYRYANGNRPPTGAQVETIDPDQN